MKCPICHHHEAKIDPIYGIIGCEACRQRPHPIPGHQIEFTTESIREQRKEFKDDIEQPHRKGHLNKRWVELYGKAAALREGYTDKEIKDATYVYRDDHFYDNN
jgi:hypothetical protein